jgi:sec-independent protein translocase protein TatC
MAITDLDGQQGAGAAGIPAPPDEEEGGSGGQMTLVEHLEELRRRIFICLGAIIVFSILAYIFNGQLLSLLLWPLPKAANALNGTHDSKIVVTQIGEAFTVTLKLSLAVGIALATPVWLYELWSFVAPALTRQEKKYALPFTLLGAGLFAVGVVVGFVTLRFPVNWLVTFDSSHYLELVSADSYFTFVAYFLLAFGIAFELPLVLTFLSLIGVVSSRWLAKNRPYMLVGLWILSTVITPGADPYSPVIVGVSLTVLYLLSEVLIRVMGK